MTEEWPEPPRTRPVLQELSPYEPGKPLDEISREYEFEGEPVKLASNENPFSPPESLRAVYEEEFDELNRYPDGGSYHLRQRLSEHYDWPIEGIVIGAGSDEVTDFLSKVYLEPDDQVIVAEPSFIRHTMLPKIMGAEPVPVPVEDDFSMDLTAMLEAVTDRTRWVCLPNPNNPTSQYVSDDKLRSFLHDLPPDLTVILDEAYYEFMDREDYPDGRRILEDFRGSSAPTIVLQRTFSKAYGLSGLRVGYGLMNPSVAQEIHKVRPPFNVTRPAQAVAEQALDENSFLRNSREKIHEERDRLLAELQSRDLDYVDPAANFFLLELPDDLTGDNFCEAMVRRGVIVRSMDPYGLDNYVRISVGAPAENDRFLAALDDFLE